MLIQVRAHAYADTMDLMLSANVRPINHYHSFELHAVDCAVKLLELSEESALTAQISATFMESRLSSHEPSSLNATMSIR